MLPRRKHRFVKRPQGVAHQHPVLVFDVQDQLHLPLTVFAKQVAYQVSGSTMLTYLYAILPFFDFLDEDDQQRRAKIHWNSPAEQLRVAITDFLTQRLSCQLQEHKLGFRRVFRTSLSRHTISGFLSALKSFYRVMCQEGYYTFPNPLIDSASAARAVVEECLESEDDHPRMPEISGVEEPRRRRRLSDSYFKLEGEQWVPQIVDDPSLLERVLEGGRRIGWRQREVCVTRILFESGGRVSEVTGLTLGDWAARGLLRAATSFSKGSRGRRVKFLRWRDDTAKLLLRYFNTERRKFDAEGYTLDQYTRLAKQQQVDLYKVPLFLTSRGTRLSPKTFREWYWIPACRATGIDVDVHQARHWYVTMAVRHIYEFSDTDGEVKRRLRELIEYMKWRSGWETLDAYQHYFDPLRHVEVQDRIHALLDEEAQQYLKRGRQGRSELNETKGQILGPEDPDYNFLIAMGGADREP